MNIFCGECDVVQPLHASWCTKANTDDDNVGTTDQVLGVLTAARALSVDEIGQVVAGLTMMAVHAVIEQQRASKS